MTMNAIRHEEQAYVRQAIRNGYKQHCHGRNEEPNRMAVELIAMLTIDDRCMDIWLRKNK